MYTQIREAEREERNGDEVWYIGKGGEGWEEDTGLERAHGQRRAAVCCLDGLFSSQKGWKVCRGHDCPVCRQLTTVLSTGDNSLSNLPSSLQMSFLLGCEKT